MTFRKALGRAGCGLSATGAPHAFQRPFRQFPGISISHSIATRLAGKDRSRFARLMFPPGPSQQLTAPRRRGHGKGFALVAGHPRADRHFSQAVRRLTRVHIRSVEQVVNLDEGDALRLALALRRQVGEWGLTDKQGQQLREVLPARRLLHGRRISMPAKSGASSRAA
jgi:hypothetical protein